MRRDVCSHWRRFRTWKEYVAWNAADDKPRSKRKSTDNADAADDDNADADDDDDAKPKKKAGSKTKSTNDDDGSEGFKPATPQ